MRVGTATTTKPQRPRSCVGIRSLGATEVVDYAGDIAAAVRASHPEGTDALIDAVNRGDDHGAVTTLVKDGGFVASTTGSADEEGLRARRIGGVNVMAQGDPGAFSRVLEMAGDGRLQVAVTQMFSFDELPDALGLVGSRSSRGKLAIRIAER